MAITIANLITNLDSFIGDTSNDRVTAAERLQYLTEGCVWLQTSLDNDHSIRTYSLSYFDTINSYKLNSDITDVLEGNALRRLVGETNDVDFTRQDARQIFIYLPENSGESPYALERRDSNLYAVINYASKYGALQVSTMDSLTADGGTWASDTTTSDALAVEVDDTDGSNNTLGCFKFDITVAQSANNRATISNATLTAEDLTDDEDLPTWLLDVKFPNVADITSVTLYWGSSSTAYWSASATTNYDGSAFTADF